MNVTDGLTDEKFWDAAYSKRLPDPLQDGDFKNLIFLQIAKKIENFGLEGKSICEIGGGDAQMLAYLARKNPGSDFSVIDYSEMGCALAEERAARENVSINVFKRDFFEPGGDLLGRFDVVFSHGVVEHFMDLPEVLGSMKIVLKNSGLVFTVIPNFSSPIYRFLCKRWSEKIFDLLVPYDNFALMRGHRDAGLEIVESGYIGSVEFGMLSMARNNMQRPMPLDRAAYIGMVAFSMGVHWLEIRIGDLPTTKMLSPFIYVAAKKK